MARKVIGNKKQKLWEDDSRHPGDLKKFWSQADDLVDKNTNTENQTQTKPGQETANDHGVVEDHHEDEEKKVEEATDAVPAQAVAEADDEEDGEKEPVNEDEYWASLAEKHLALGEEDDAEDKDDEEDVEEDPDYAASKGSIVAKGTPQSGTKNDELKNFNDTQKRHDYASGITKDTTIPVALKVNEDIEAVFNGEDLSEEFKSKAKLIWKSALKAHLKESIELMKKDYTDRLNQIETRVKDQLAEEVDRFLDYVVRKWAEDNAPAVENNIRNEIVESFMLGLKQVFSDHYINIPDDKVDLVNNLATKVERLEEELNTEIKTNVELKRELQEVKKENYLRVIGEGLTDSQFDKFKALVEEIDFEDDKQYSSKLTVIKESYFGKNSNTPKRGQDLTESSITESQDIESPVDEDSLQYAVLKILDRMAE